MEIFLLFILLILACILLRKFSDIKQSIRVLTETVRDLRNQVIEMVKSDVAVPPKEVPSKSPVETVSDSETPVFDNTSVSVAFSSAVQNYTSKSPVPEQKPEPEPSEMSPEMLGMLTGAVKIEPPIERSKEKPIEMPVAEKSNTILDKIWIWLLVGEEFRPKNMSMEYGIASTWLMRLGIITLMICVGFFLKWSIDRGFLGPIGRVALSVMAGVGILVTGLRLFGKKYNILGQGLAGGGLATLYFSMFAAGPMYHLIPLPACFGLMILVTLTAGWLSVSFGSMLIAILGIIGGFSTPLMLQTPEPSLVVLYSYMILLSVGILGIAHVKQWRLLNYLGFVFTWILFFVSLQAYDGARDFTVGIVFLSILFLLHSAITYYYNFIKRLPTAGFDIVHLFFNTVLYAAVSYKLIFDACGRPWPAVMSIGLAVFFIVHVFMFLRSRHNDRNLLITFIGIAGFFTALAVPLITEHETITVCWALQALFFLWVGLKLESNFITTVSSVLYCIVVGRLVALDMPAAFVHLGDTTIPIAKYWPGLLERLWTFGTVIASMFAASLLYKRKVKVISGLSVEVANDIEVPISRPIFREILHWCGIGFLFACCYLEMTLLFGYYVPLQMPILTILWLVLGLYLMRESKTRKSDILLDISILVIVITLLKLAIFDLPSWEFYSLGAVYRQGFLAIGYRFIDYAALFGMVMALGKLTTGRQSPVDFVRIISFVGNAIFFLYITFEVNSLFHWYVPAFQSGALSVLWAIFAVSYVIFGIWRTSKPYRYIGLALFVLVVGKVFLFDLSGMEVIYRILAFMLVGFLLLAGSVAYVRSSSRFIQKVEENV